MNKISVKTYIFFLIYAIITFILVLHHEVWRDEAQVWQLCTHLSVLDLFKHLVNEGHPSFFYLINMPFAKLGFPILTMQIICWLASCGAVYLILNKSPFNKATKIVLVTSGLFLYFFPVIARSYSILPLMVFALAMLYPKQKEHPYWYTTIIFLMANTHVIMLGFAGMLTLMFMWENLWHYRKEFSFNLHKNYIYSSLIALFGLFAVWLQLHGTTTSNVFIAFDLKNIFLNILNVITKFFVAGFDASFAEVFDRLILNNFQTTLVLFSLFLFIALFVLIFKNSKKLFFISLLGVLFQFLIYVLAYNKCVLSQRTFCAYIIIIFALWCVLNQNNITEKMRKTINITMIIFFLLTTLNGIRFAILDFKYSYSGSKETAQFIENNIEKEALFIIDKKDIIYCVSLLPYLEKTSIFNIPDNQVLRYVLWNEELIQYMSDTERYILYRKKLNDEFNTKTIYIIKSIINNELFRENNKNFELIFSSVPSVIFYEKYYIYKYLGNN